MNGEQKVIKLLIVALVVLILLVIGLLILFSIAFKNVQNSSIVSAGDADIVSAIKSLKVVNGKDGVDGLSIQGAPGATGANGKDSQSTTTIIQQPVNGTNGLSAYEIWLQNGNSGNQTDFLNSLKPVVACPDLQFDGIGNYRCHESDDWLPLEDTQ